MSELAIPFEEKLSPFTDVWTPEDFKVFSPSGLVPCLIDKHMIVWDSFAITEYLAEKHARVWPDDVAARTWARCATAEMHSGFFAIRNQCSMNCGLRVQLHTISASLQQDLQRLEALWNQGLTEFGGPFLAGDQFSAVDAFYAPVVSRIQTYNIKLSSACSDYVQAILALSSMQQWYAAALEEVWRESSHEQEAAAAGTIIEDYRKA